MTQQLTTLALQNEPLLRALKTGEATGTTDLADRAGVIVNHVNRRLDALIAEGLIIRAEGAKAHEATLTPAAEAALEILSTRLIPFFRIAPWDGNPRSPSTISDDDDQAMARSIADKGVLQPLVVRPRFAEDGEELYEVVIGERRRRGAALAVKEGWQPSDFLVPCKVRDLSDDDALEIAGVENLQREDMHWMDEAKFYLKLASRLSAPAIERLVGGARGKRSIQDYIKCARELSAEDIARTYLADGHKDQLTYVKARDLTGEKKEKPALDLPPKQALALLEVIELAFVQDPAIVLMAGKTYTARLPRAPTGGPLIALSNERKLIDYGFDGPVVLANVKATDDVMRFLAQTGWTEASDVAILKARAAVIGDLQATVVKPGEWVTPELNPPEPAAAPPPTAPSGPELTPAQRRMLREIAARSLHRHRVLDGWVEAQAEAIIDPDYEALYDLELVVHNVRTDGLNIALTLKGRDFLKSNGMAPEEPKSRNSCVTPWLREPTAITPAEPTAPAIDAPPAGLPGFHDDDGDEDDDGERAEPATEPTVHQLPMEAPPPPAPAGPVIPAIQAMVLVELAHHVAANGTEISEGVWGAPVYFGFHRDARGQELVQKHRMLVFRPHGAKTMVTLTAAALEWLETEHNVWNDKGRPVLLDAERAMKQGGGGAQDGAAYSTPWLNPPADIGADAAPTAPPPADTFGDQIRAVANEARAIQALDSALRQALELLERLPTLAKPPKAADIAPIVQIGNAAREAIRPFLSQEAA